MTVKKPFLSSVFFPFTQPREFSIRNLLNLVFIGLVCGLNSSSMTGLDLPQWSGENGRLQRRKKDSDSESKPRRELRLYLLKSVDHTGAPVSLIKWKQLVIVFSFFFPPQVKNTKMWQKI